LNVRSGKHTTSALILIGSALFFEARRWSLDGYSIDKRLSLPRTCCTRNSSDAPNHMHNSSRLLYDLRGRAGSVAHTQGKEIVDGTGKPLLLRGTNLGNWLVPEGYMWHLNNGGPESPREIEAPITELLNRSEPLSSGTAIAKTTSHRDIHFIKQCGFNSIRVPLVLQVLRDRQC